MKKSILISAVLPALCLCLALSFGSADEEEKKSAGRDEAKISALIEKLGAENYEEREEAFEHLKKLGEKARPYLKKELESDDLEVRWRASKLLSLLDKRRDKVPKGDEPSDDIMNSMLRRLDELEKKMLKDRRDLEGDYSDWIDKLLKRRMDDLWGGDPFFKFDFFDDDYISPLDKLMEELKKKEGGLKFEIGGSKLSYSMERRDEGGGEKLTLDISEDGSVKATITRTDWKGEETSEQVFEAESMEAFKKAYPDVVERFGLNDFSLSFRMPDKKWKWTLPRAFEGKRSPAPILPPESEKRKTLGIFIDPDGPGRVLRAHLGLKEGRGVIVDKVLEGSFASKVGLKPMDVVITINGRDVGCAKDIREALIDVGDGQKMEITLFRFGKKKILSGDYTSSIAK